MAALTVATATDSPNKSSEAKRILISGDGDEATTVIAASTTGYQHIVTKCHVSWNGGGAENIVIKSGSTTLHTIYLIALATNFDIPPGLIYTAEDEALIFDKSAATGIASIMLEYVTVIPGSYVGIL